jgi:hypothetical protein
MPADLLSPSPPPTIPKLLLTAREAAAALSICGKTLFTMTAPRGPLRCIRIGKSVRYAVTDLQQFIAEAGRESGAIDSPEVEAACQA